jgi:hypothetical protein
MPDKVYLDESGNPIQGGAPPKVYLDENGNEASAGNAEAVDHFIKQGKASHPLLREGALGALGTYAPESAHPVKDMGTGFVKTFVAPPQGMDEMAVAAPTAGLALPGYRMAKGFGSQVKQAGQEIYEGAGSPSIGLHHVSIAPPDKEKVAHGFGTLLGFASQAAIPAATEAVGERVNGMLPNKARAGATLGSVRAQAGAEVVDANKYSDAILRVKELADRGGKMPTPVNKLLNRITSPNAAPLPFEEARDFYHNISTLSADEMSRLTPVMKRAVGELRVKFGEAITDAADKVGLGDVHKGAMKEFAQAARFDEYKQLALKAAKDHVLPGVAKGAGIATGAYVVGKKLLGY